LEEQPGLIKNQKTRYFLEEQPGLIKDQIEEWDTYAGGSGACEAMPAKKALSTGEGVAPKKRCLRKKRNQQVCCLDAVEFGSD
jgi:hypothetical protein